MYEDESYLTNFLTISLPLFENLGYLQHHLWNPITMDNFYRNQDFKYFIAMDVVTTKYSCLVRHDADNTTTASTTTAAKTMMLFNYHHRYSLATLNLFYFNSLSRLDCFPFYYSAFALYKNF